MQKRCATYFSIIFSQIGNFVEEFKKGMKFLFFLILIKGISGYFLLRSSAKNDLKI